MLLGNQTQCVNACSDVSVTMYESRETKSTFPQDSTPSRQLKLWHAEKRRTNGTLEPRLYIGTVFTYRLASFDCSFTIAWICPASPKGITSHEGQHFLVLLSYLLDGILYIFVYFRWRSTAMFLMPEGVTATCLKLSNR